MAREVFAEGSGLGLRISGSGLRVSGFGFRVSGSGFGVRGFVQASVVVSKRPVVHLVGEDLGFKFKDSGFRV